MTGTSASDSGGRKNIDSKVRETCKSCTKKITGEKFNCVYCPTVLHMTPECTLLDSDCVAALIKLRNNVLHVCNSCIHRRQNTMSTNDRDVNENVEKLREQVAKNSEQMEKSLRLIEEIGNELKKVQSKPTGEQTYANALVSVRPGKTITSQKETKELGIRFRGIPESKDVSSDEQLQHDLNAVKAVLNHLQINDQPSVVQRVGKFDPDPGKSRTIIVNLKTPVNKDLLLKSAYKLKDFHDLGKPVFVSPELTIEEYKREREALRLRRKLLESKAFEPFQLRIRDLKLQVKTENKWDDYVPPAHEMDEQTTTA